MVDKEVRPVVRELEHANTYPEDPIEQMKEMGIYGLAIPEPLRRNAGLHALLRPSHRRVGPWLDELGRGDGGTHRRRQTLLLFGTDEQKQRYLPKMATGEIRATMALTEPGGGSDLQNMRTSARRDGDHYVVNGSKT